MDLHSGVPFWRAIGHPLPKFPRAEGDIRCEVAVIGGGITGALISQLLIDAGMDVVLLDKAQPAEGSTAASTGLLQYEIDTPLVALIKAVGQDKAVHAYRRGLVAIDELEALVERLGGRCGFSRRPSLYFASHWWHVRSLRQEYECRRAHGLPVEWLSRRQLAEKSSIRAAGALWSASDGQLDPYATTSAVLKHAVSRGLRVFSFSEATAVKEHKSQVRLELNTAAVAAQAVVYASGYEAHHQLPGWPGKLHSTYAVASEPLESFAEWPEGCLIWETARPYFYARQTDDGRALIGGADTAFAMDHQRGPRIEKKVEVLAKRFSRLFPQLAFRPACAWAGTFAETKDGLAYIGKVPGQANVYAALGYGGNGITFSMIAARLVTDLFLKRPNPDAAVFCFER